MNLYAHKTASPFTGVQVNTLGCILNIEFRKYSKSTRTLV